MAAELEANEARTPEGTLDAVVARKSQYCKWLDAQHCDSWADLFTDDASPQSSARSRARTAPVNAGRR
jgi:hypothetical protein